MKLSLKLVGTFVLALVTFATAGTALAQRHGGHARFGVYVGAPYYYGPAYYPSYYYPRPYYYPPYYPPVVVAPSAPPAYVEQNSGQTAPAAAAPQQAAPQQNWWYYCAESGTYYPYAKECAAGWQRVAPQAPQG